MSKKRAIIWGHDNYNTLGLLRQLAEGGVETYFLVLGKAEGCATASRHCIQYQIEPTIESGFKHLSTHPKFTQQNDKAVLFTPSDEIIEYIDQHKSVLEPHYCLPGTRTSGLLTQFDDKNRQWSLAQKLGFTVPQSTEIRWDSDIGQVGYPCILKPSHITPNRHNEFKYKICHSETELKRCLHTVLRDSTFVVQDYIPKSHDCLVYGARLWDGNVIIAGALLRDRFCYTGESSHGLITPTLPSGVDASKITAFLEYIDYYGLFSVEYGLCEGIAYFFEFNLRNDGTSHLFHQAGANIPLAWMLSSLHEEPCNIVTSVQKEAYYIDEVGDITNVWNHSISRRKWKAERQQARIFKYYDESDTSPYKNMKRRRLSRFLSDEILKRFRPFIVRLMSKF